MTTGIDHRVRWSWLLGLVLFLLPGCGDSSVTIVTVPSQREAMEIATALQDSLKDLSPGTLDVSAVQSQRQTVYAIRVPEQAADTARRILLQRELPRESEAGLESLATGGGFIPSKSEEQARMMRAIAGELERSIQTIEGVVVARVHIVLRENDPLASSGQAVQSASASVLVKYLPSAIETTGGGQATIPEKADASKPAAGGLIPINLQQLIADSNAAGTEPDSAALKRSQAIQQFIARAVPGLDEQRVAVLFTPARDFAPRNKSENATTGKTDGTETSTTEGSELLDLDMTKYALLAATAVFGIAALVFAYLWLSGRQGS